MYYEIAIRNAEPVHCAFHYYW